MLIHKEARLKLPEPCESIDENHVFARIYGTGFPLLAIHGNCGSGYTFSKIVGGLALKYRVILVDLPGHGNGPEIGDDFRLDSRLSVDYCFKLMNKLNINEYHLCGHSLGGMIALLMKLERPDEIKSIVLLDSFIDHKERFTNGYDLLFRMDNFPGSPSILKEEIDDALDDGPGVLWYQRFNVSRRIKEISCPVLEIQGESNPNTQDLFEMWLTDKRCGYPPDWKIVRAMNSGHFVQIEQPEFVLDNMLSLLKA